jgi:hypothetical protein
MKKIVSLFMRNYDGDRLVRNQVVPGAEWVANGEGVATRKFKGTCCMIKDGKLFKRYDAKNGKLPPAGFIAAQDPDPNTGHWPGWVPVTDADKWHMQAWENYLNSLFPDEEPIDDTYELCGPKVQGNPEKLEEHILIRHGYEEYPNFPRDFDGIKKRLGELTIEGVVWHHPDGRMVKIKAKDFGLR